MIRYSVHIALVSAQSRHTWLGSLAKIPHFDRRITGCTRYIPRITSAGNIPDTTRMTLEHSRTITGIDVPDTESLITTLNT